MQTAFSCLCLLLAEGILAYSADRAYPVFGKIFESCSGSDTVVRITYFGIIDIAACITFVFAHKYVLLISSVDNYYIHTINNHSNIVRNYIANVYSVFSDASCT